MLKKEYLRELLRDRKYIEISKIFEEEYYLILKEFCNKTRISIQNSEDINSLIVKIKYSFPKYKGLMGLLSSSLNDEELLIDERLNKLLDNYNVIRTNLT